MSPDYERYINTFCCARLQVQAGEAFSLAIESMDVMCIFQFACLDSRVSTQRAWQAYRSALGRVLLQWCNPCRRKAAADGIVCKLLSLLLRSGCIEPFAFAWWYMLEEKHLESRRCSKWYHDQKAKPDPDYTYWWIRYYATRRSYVQDRWVFLVITPVTFKRAHRSCICIKWRVLSFFVKKSCQKQTITARLRFCREQDCLPEALHRSQVQSIPVPRAQGMSYTLPADRPHEA